MMHNKSEQNIVDQVYGIFINSKGVSIDTRTLEAGQIFFALKGNNFDANNFVKEAAEKGAIAIICEKSSPSIDPPHIFIVKSPLAILQDLATHHIKQFDAPILAVTGSNGKTTNKELISKILSEKYQVHSTPGNFNNNIGLPLTILQAPPETDFFVLEMGTNHFGEIKDLCRIAEPDFGIILNIGKSHLEYLHSIEGVLKAKSELADYLFANNGKLFVNTEEKSIESLKSHPVNKILFASKNLYKNISLGNVRKSPFLHFVLIDNLKNIKVAIKTKLIGDHNLNNIKNAVSISLFFDIPLQSIKTAIEKFEPGSNRSRIVHWNNNTVVLDAYNANPTSMWASIQAFDSSFTKPKILIIGEMGELGAVAEEEHTDLISKINLSQVDEIHLIGQIFQHVEIPTSKPFFLYANTDEFILQTKKTIENKNANILIKGSRFLQLENIIRPLTL